MPVQSTWISLARPHDNEISWVTLRKATFVLFLTYETVSVQFKSALERQFPVWDHYDFTEKATCAYMLFYTVLFTLINVKISA